MDMFKMIKEAATMKSRLNEMEKALRARVVDVEGAGVVIKINAKSEIVGIKLTPELLKNDVDKVEKTILATIEAATKKSQALMMEEAKKMTGGMKVPGLM